MSTRNAPYYSLFPKFFQSLSLDELGAATLEAGFDAVDLIVRDGYWVTPLNMATEVTPFILAMQRHNVKVQFATTGYSADELLQDATPLQVMADAGIRGFRMSYFNYSEREDIFTQLDRARASMNQMAELCAKHRLKAVYQVHHGDKMLIPHSLAALYVVRDLPPEHVGIMLDPGNQFREGSENWRRAIVSLGHYLAAIGVKDGRYSNAEEERSLPSKGWKPEFAPCQEGVTNWSVIAAALHDIKFQGVLNFQPFYHSDNIEQLLPTLKEEVDYVRRALEQQGGRSLSETV